MGARERWMMMVGEVGEGEELIGVVGLEGWWCWWEESDRAKCGWVRRGWWMRLTVCVSFLFWTVWL